MFYFTPDSILNTLSDEREHSLGYPDGEHGSILQLLLSVMVDAGLIIPVQIPGVFRISGLGLDILTKNEMSVHIIHRIEQQQGLYHVTTPHTSFDVENVSGRNLPASTGFDIASGQPLNFIATEPPIIGVKDGSTLTMWGPYENP